MAVPKLVLSGLALCALMATAAASPSQMLPSALTPQEAAAPTNSPSAARLVPPLSTYGRHVVDARGSIVRLDGFNWYGAHDTQFVPGGLDVRHRDAIAALIRAQGFNAVRLAFSDELVRRNPRRGLADGLAANPDLAGRSALDVLEAVVQALDRQQVAVVLSNHSTAAGGRAALSPCEMRWYNVPLPGCRQPQSEDAWRDDWRTLTRRLAKYPYVVGVDLRSEVRGPWLSWERWAAAAESAAAAVHGLAPHLLVMVGGLAGGQDLGAVRQRPVRLRQPHRLVYAAHAYAWSWAHGRGRLYGQQSYAQLSRSLTDSWAFILDAPPDVQAPVWLGEVGVAHSPLPVERRFWDNLMAFVAAHDVGMAYWALNARGPGRRGRETYSLLDAGWGAFVDDFRFRALRRAAARPVAAG